MKTRRDFLRSSAVGTTAALSFPALGLHAGAANKPAQTHPIVGTKEAGGRKSWQQTRGVSARHRNLFNGDTGVFFYNPEKWHPEGRPFSAKAIHRYVDVLADNGIDTFVINANASRAWYPSKVVPTLLDGYKRGDREFCRGHAVCAGITEPTEVEKFLDRSVEFLNLYQDLLDAGVDWLAETAKACRRRGVSPWVSIRMNDMHGASNFQGSYFNLPLLGRKEMRLQQSAYPAGRGSREGLNYERSEVRAHMFAQIRDVVENYDFEGIELDWWRNPLCCEPNATDDTVEMMNNWFRDIRALTERRARETGRPYPFGFRMPGRLELLKSIGIDVATLCHEGTLDFIGPSNSWRTSWDMPHDELRQQLGERVAIYGVIEDGVNRLSAHAPMLDLTREMRLISTSREMMHANAAGKLVLGADGIEWFNFFCTDQIRLNGVISDYTSLRDIHRLEHLRGQPKHYTFPDHGGGGTNIPFDQAAQLPVVLERGWHTRLRLPMCAEPNNRGLELLIQVVLKADDKPVALPVSINGCWPRKEYVRTDHLLFPCGAFTHHAPEHVGCNIRFPVSLIRDGWDEIVIGNGGDETITVVGIELAIRRSTEGS